MKAAWAKVVTLTAGIILLGYSTAESQVTGFPTRARVYSSWLARAFDPCTPGGLTVSSPPGTLPSSGCLASISDPLPPPLGSNALGATMKFGRLVVKRFPGTTGGQGKLKLMMFGLQNGQRVKVRLTVRTTRSGVTTKHPPKTNAVVTFQDTTFDCQLNASSCFIANPRGVVVASQTLDQCLAQSSQPTGLASHNLEILSAEVINCDDGFVIARPGILN